MHPATYWLLAALATTTALAQTPATNTPARQPGAVGQQQMEAPAAAPRPRRDGIRPDREPPAATPAVPPDATKVYFYVEQMPLLNGQHAYLASIAAITRAVVVPAGAPAGRVYVQFVVTSAGQVSHPHIVKGLRADLDSAVVAATRQLPRFTPGKQGNHVVAVSITVAVTFPVKQS